MEILSRFLSFHEHPERWIPWIERLGKAAIVLGLAWLFSRLMRRLLHGLRIYSAQSLNRHGSKASAEIDQRTTTIISVLTKVINILIWALAIVMALTEMTFKIEPLLAGLGVAGLAFGLGAQTLIKDWLGGLFILLEDQIRLGDTVVINNITGTVEELNLRTTVLRSENGAVHMIPNGSITIITNQTREYAYYVFETTIAHRADAETALRLIAEAGAALPNGSTLAPLELLGVERLGEKGAVLKARIQTLPGQQAPVGRELNLRVKSLFDQAGIEFPKPS